MGTLQLKSQGPQSQRGARVCMEAVAEPPASMWANSFDALDLINLSPLHIQNLFCLARLGEGPLLQVNLC